eukprot:scaffold1021_cov241-Pinguiococcus_pyrenoidosus.AAC.1
MRGRLERCRRAGQLGRTSSLARDFTSFLAIGAQKLRRADATRPLTELHQVSKRKYSYSKVPVGML